MCVTGLVYEKITFFDFLEDALNRDIANGYEGDPSDTLDRTK